MRGQPSFLFMKNGNGMLNIFVHGLIRFALDVLPNHGLKFRSKSNLHVTILPLQSSDSTTQYTPVGYVAVRA
jgi:hypothetical protein